jgi:PAS domain S-box-containing protein
MTDQRDLAYFTHLIQDELSGGLLLDALAEAVVVIERSGTIVYVNRRTCELFGYELAELSGAALDLLLPDRYQLRHQQHLTDYFVQPRTRPMGPDLELIGRHKSGAEIALEVSLTHLTTSAGPLAVAFVTDTTRRRETERALQQRTEDLNAFAHMVAHDLDAQLSVIIGFSEFLAENHGNFSPQELSGHLLRVMTSGHKMSNIIHELLLFANIRREDIELQLLDMEDVLHEVLRRMPYWSEEYHATLKLPDKWPDALGYAPWVEEVWFNYVSNALRYGGRPPHIELGGMHQPDGHVRFWVRDNGLGLAAEQQAHIFDPPGSDDRPKFKGHGLGLPIVRRIVDKLGGRVWVESRLNEGSTFYFTLPAGQSPQRSPRT